MDIAQYEDKTVRGRVAESIFGYTYSRAYDLPPEALGLVPALGAVQPGYVAELDPWLTGTVYVIGSVVSSGDPLTGYRCDTNHTSGAGTEPPHANWVAVSLLVPRVQNTPYIQQKDGARQRLTLAFFQPVAYTGGVVADHYIEIRGSRAIGTGAFQNTKQSLGVTDTGADIPVRGDLFTGETGLFAHRCTGVQRDSRSMPGIELVTAAWGSFVAYL